MKRKYLSLSLFMLLFASLACNFLLPGKSDQPENLGKSVDAPKVDFTAPAKPLNVTVALDEKSSTSGKVTPKGGRMTLKAKDGTVFTLEIPAKALKVDMQVTMTAVKSLDGAPLGSGELAAVQLEPSGLVFDQWVTLTIAPAKEILVEKQIIFNYEGSGQDYHLAVVDPKSREIKIKLLGFSGAGVGSGDDKAWAATLQSQASEASARLLQQLGEATQTDRRNALLGGESNLTGEMIDSFFDQYYDQVVLKEIAAAELDCKHAAQAAKDLIMIERLNQILGSGEIRIPNFAEKVQKMAELGGNCGRAYSISGTLDEASMSGVTCDSSKPFTIGGTLTFNFVPSSPTSGTFSYSGPYDANGSGPYTIGENGGMTISGVGCVMTGACASFTRSWNATPIDPASCGG